MENLALWYRRFGEPESVLQPETAPPGALAPGQLRVRMLFSPVNASDLIPITGAYRHRTPLPAVAGYEGVGVVTEAPASFKHLVGQRVLPLRGQGTWQRYVDCPAEYAIPVPDTVDAHLAARAYINPLAAQMMLTRYPPRGKRVLLTAAGSDCAILLGQWARQAGAEAVYGIHRSAVHAERLEAMGITPVAQHDANRIGTVAARSDIVYDATGGPLAETILSVMPEQGMFVCYGLLSGQTFTQRRPAPRVVWFHIRNGLDALSVEAWRAEFGRIWLRLPDSEYSDVTVYPLAEWRRALSAYREGGRTRKPLLSMAE
ncbi:alcohol dehydrogenase [Enterobacter roggenkampii]|uniref:zinc-dependent alcohol dehydrogenase family protein n=1 Tax=Enterobacter sp. NFIX58 TaxID=1566251 RepID=UPI0005F98D3A|nr:zinc-dependent alcohol dehydrogenase family protein [Enterobacter sp. NFIX58]KJW95820.1 alcohol dehydrogenase [Enterobacter roggenkampii]MBG0667442.1 zinc-dependent alcohol dehydrogenase family protein [Enterobacter roggenkampii]SEO54308.1 NADPH:quinone reductase [Enterobacter sp. NFIX58]